MPGSDVTGEPIEVLVVDDDQDIRTLVRVHLELDGRFGRIHEAARADAGLRLARAHPDVRGVILDQEMPDRTGVDVLPELRAALPTAAIVMFTSDETVHFEALQRGADAAYVKTTPLPVVLRRVVEAAP